MFGFLRKRSGASTNPGTEIPRYPPFARGLPAVNAAELLTTQEELVASLRSAIGISRDEYDKLMMPVIRRYAAYVHLLPASEAHHHRGAGGLLHHGLEVAFLAARSAEDVLFAPEATPRLRRELEPRWRLATTLAGLIHDVGKPVSDLTVMDRDGAKKWSPYKDNLTDWARRESIDRYFLHWHPGRHRRHEQFSVLVVERVLTREVVDWLSEYTPDILSALLSAVSRMETDTSRIAQLLRYADNVSVSRDMARFREPYEEAHGVPVERYIVDAIRQLITRGEWTINQKGSRGWIFNDGFYVCWNAAAEDVRTVLARDGVSGVPRDADSMADILIDRQIAESRSTEGATYRYWPMRPSFFGDSDPHRLMMLKLNSDTFFNEPPAPIAAEIIENRQTRGDKDRQSSAKDSDRRKVKPTPRDHSMPTLPAPEQESTTASVESQSEQPPDLATCQSWAEQGSTEQGENDITQSAPTAQIAEPAMTGQAGAPKPPEDAQTEVSADIDAGAATPILLELRDKAVWEETVFRRRGETLISYPRGVEMLGDPLEIQQILADAGALTLDPKKPMLNVREIDGQRGLVIRPKFADRLWPEMPEKTMIVDRNEAEPPASRTPSGKTVDNGAAAPDPQKSQKPENTPPPNETPARPRTSTRNHKSDTDTVIGDLLKTIRDHDPDIPGGVSQSEGELHVSQVVIAWFAKTRARTKVSANKLRTALTHDPSVRLCENRLTIQETPDG